MSRNHKRKYPEAFEAFKAFRKTSFHDLPAELRIIIISYVDLDPATFRSLSLLDRRTHFFLINHEFELVKNVVQNQNRLAGLLALPDRPTFKDYLSLQIEERSLIFVYHTLFDNFLYNDWVSMCVVDSDDLERPEALLLMLRAGLYIHFRAACLKNAREREDFMMNLSEEAWALLNQFSFFVMKAVHLGAFASKLKPLLTPSRRAPAQNYQRDYDMVIEGVVELAFYSGMHALDDFLNWRYSIDGGAEISDARQWMSAFLTYNLEKSVLVKEDASFSYRDLLMQVFNIPTMQLARKDITLPGRGNIIRLSEENYPGVTQASLGMMTPCPKLVVMPESPQECLGMELDRRQHWAASAVIRLTGLKAAANAGILKDSGFLRRLIELGVDNRSLVRRHLVEGTLLKNLREWNCCYTAAILGCSLFRTSRIGLVAPHFQVKTQQPTSATSCCPNCCGKKDSGKQKC